MTRGKAFGWFMLGYVTANLLTAGIDALANWYEKKEAEQAGQDGIDLAIKDAFAAGEVRAKAGRNAGHVPNQRAGMWTGDVVSAYPKDLTDTIRDNIRKEQETLYTGDYPTREDVHPLGEKEGGN